MEKIKVIYDTIDHSMTVWLSDPKQKYICEETADEVVMMRNKKGKVIRFERLHFKTANTESNLSVETILKISS